MFPDQQIEGDKLFATGTYTYVFTSLKYRS